ncbi:MAG TPA: FmdE family protein [Methanocella sp.]|nr:FmdE family protein [Methanocella sp.]
MTSINGAEGITPDIPSFSDVERYHGHTCPGIIFGYRMSILAMSKLAITNGDDFIVIGETGRCPVDAVQVVTGCTIENGRLTVFDVGKSAFTYINRKSGQALRIWVKPEIEISNINPRWDKLRKKLASSEATKEEAEEYDQINRNVADTLMEMTDEDMLIVRRAVVRIPATEKSEGFVICSDCGEKLARSRSVEIEGTTCCIPCSMREHN